MIESNSTRLRPPTARIAAGYAADREWFVVPLHTVRRDGGCTCPLGDECGHTAKHPDGRLAPSGINSATRLPHRIEGWFTRRPWANVGIATGPSGLVVLDLDPRNGGQASLSALTDRHGALPPTLTCLTGGAGWHYIFRAWDRQPGSGTMAPGVDIEARGGLVVAPPSVHRSGGTYRWLDADAPIAAVPDFLARWDER